MCTICTAFQPFKDGCDYDGLGRSTTGVAVTEAPATSGDTAPSNIDSAPFTVTQIAQVLTDGYWNDTGRSQRAFDVEAGDTLTYDISGLNSAGRVFAEYALEAWSEVTGIIFEEFDDGGGSSRNVTETQVSIGSDAGETPATAGSILVGDIVTGNQTSGSDEDWYGVNLVAGQTYTISLTGLSHSDTFLRLYNSSGSLLEVDDDDGPGLNSQLTFTASSTGRYYIEADGYSTNSGTYELEISEGASGNGAHITFDDSDSGAYATSDVSGSTITSSFVNISTGWIAGDGTRLDTYSFQTYVHEIGHALGLGHAGFYNGNANYGSDNHYDNDSWQMSIMSYFDQNDNTSVDATFAAVITPMIADIAAVENLYGPATIRAGNTVYGANSNVDGYLGEMFDILFDGGSNASLYGGEAVTFTIADTSGFDTIDLSTVNESQTIDLNSGGISNVDGLVGNMVIAENTVIEGFEGGSSADTVFGNAANNTLNGNSGNDVLRGNTGNDTINGGAGADDLYGGSGNDDVNGGTGSDEIVGSSGRDDLRGEDGNDDIEGGSEADELRGQAGEDELWGNEGGDYISGGSGDDRLFGGAARDFMYGGQDDDRIAGEDGSDRLYGQSGDDYLIGGADTDWLYGGTGEDQFLFGENFDKDLVRDFENNVDTILINDNLWSGTKTVQDVLDDYAVRDGADVVFDFGNGDILIVENTNFSALSNDILIV